jgi:N-acetylmuramoyl-L-alanine amidase
MHKIHSLLFLILFIWAVNLNAVEVNKDELVAAVLILEAGGEKDPYAMNAVYEVINNRARARNKSEFEVVTAKYQFSCLNNISHSTAIAKAKNHPKWSKAKQIILNKNNANKVLGANHYYANTMPKPPYWAKNKRPVIQIGRHIFYKI